MAEGLVLALAQLDGEDMDKSAILNTSIPVTSAEISKWQDTVVTFKEKALKKAMMDAIFGLDEVVGRCLALSSDDIMELQRDLESDPS